MFSRNKRGFSLPEVLIAVGAVGGMGMSLMSLVSGGAQVGARASEMQMACMVGTRVMDRMAGVGYQGLDRKREKSGPEGVLDLGALEPGRERKGKGKGRGRREPPPETRESKTLTVDGFEYTGKYGLAVAAPGLMKITLNIAWDRHGVNAPKSPGNLEIHRYVADPMAGLGNPVAR